MVTGVADSEARRKNSITSPSVPGVTISSAWPWNPEASSTSVTRYTSRITGMINGRRWVCLAM
jgi:hypothetical protein